MKVINCLGDICPIPIIHLKKELHNIKEGHPVMIVSDHSCTLKAIKEVCSSNDLHYDIDEVITGVWEIHITNRKSVE